MDDRFDRQAEATIYSIAEDRRRLEALTQERNELYDANARMSAQLEVLREELRHREEEIVRRNILAESWHGEAMRLRAAGDIAIAAWMTAVGQEDKTDDER
jgi:predicted nuclease with TOPRIM domain